MTIFSFIAVHETECLFSLVEKLQNSRNSFENKTFNLKNKMMMKEKRRLDFIFIGLMSFLKIGFIVSMNLWLKPAQADLLTQRFVYWPIEHFYPGAKLCRINIYIFKANSKWNLRKCNFLNQPDSCVLFWWMWQAISISSPGRNITKICETQMWKT